MLGAPDEVWGVSSSARTEVSATHNMPANLENPAVATGRGRSVFIPVPKEGIANLFKLLHNRTNLTC